MRAIVITRHGGPEVLEAKDSDELAPGKGQLLVDVAFAGVNYMDVYQRLGRPPYAQGLPVIAGAEGAGTVRALGDGVDGFAVGDRVAWADAPGSYASEVLVPADKAVAVPSGIGLDTAAAVMLQGITAHYLSHSTFRPEPGDAVVVHAAAGGVGLLLVQLLHVLQAVVIATTSDEEKGRLAAGAGADLVTRYENVTAAVAEATDDRGVAAVYDGVGAATFETSLTLLHPRGYLVLFGAASGPVAPFDLARLAQMGSLFVTRPTFRHYVASREEFVSRTSDLFEAIATGRLDVRVGAVYPLVDAARAQEDLEARRTTGKVLLSAR